MSPNFKLEQCSYCGGLIHEGDEAPPERQRPRHRQCGPKAPGEIAAEEAARVQLETWRKHLVGRLARKLNMALQGERLELGELHPTNNPSGYPDTFDVATLEIDNNGWMSVHIEDCITGHKVEVRLIVKEIDGIVTEEERDRREFEKADSKFWGV